MKDPSETPSDNPAQPWPDAADLHPARWLEPLRRPTRRTMPLPDGGHTTVYVHARSAIAPKRPVVYVHGIQSHAGWYVASAAALADAGYPVFQVTRRGSGDSPLPRGHARSARQLLDDVDAACRFAQDQTHAERVHLLGVSWGGKLLAAWACQAERAARAASLTMIAPGIVPRVGVPWEVKLGVALTLLAAPRVRFPLPLDDVALFTDEADRQQYLRDDPRQLHRATGRLLYSSRCLDRMIRRAPRGAVSLPTTLILASRDRIIDNDRTRDTVARLTAGAAHVDVLDGCHSLEFEPDLTALVESLTAALARAEHTAD